MVNLPDGSKVRSRSALFQFHAELLARVEVLIRTNTRINSAVPIAFRRKKYLKQVQTDTTVYLRVQRWGKDNAYGKRSL